MSDYRAGPTPEAAESPRASHLEVIEEDLDTVDAALEALDSGDLEGAEALGAELGALGAELGAPGADGSGPAA